MEEIDINGQRFQVVHVQSKNKNASARLRDGIIVINIPSWWPDAEKERSWASLRRRAIRSIENGTWNCKDKSLRFFNGQKLKALENEFEIAFSEGKRFGARIDGNRIDVRIAGHPDRETKIARLVKREIVKKLMPALSARVRTINQKHFGSEISKITIRDNSSRWGSCSTNGNISINFRLLFMPESILDYVIVHELAHTKYKSHGKRFWATVERVLPDYKEKRKWLRKNGHSVLSDEKMEWNYF